MNVTARRSKSVEARVAAILASRADSARNDQIRRETAERIRALEAKYNIPSAELDEALRSGRLQENLEICEWRVDYHFLSGPTNGQER